MEHEKLINEIFYVDELECVYIGYDNEDRLTPHLLGFKTLNEDEPHTTSFTGHVVTRAFVIKWVNDNPEKPISKKLESENFNFETYKYYIWATPEDFSKFTQQDPLQLTIQKINQELNS